MQFIKNHKLLAGILSLGILGSILITVFAVTLTDGMYNSPVVAASWSPGIEQDGKDMDLTPTGYAYNGTFITGKPNKMYPFAWKPFFEKRSGKTVPDNLKEFDGKYMYCVANHTQNYKLEFGTQAYFDKQFTTKNIPEFTPDEYNFIMLAQACYYPGSKELSQSNQHPAGTPAYLVSQCIAWMATEGRFSPEEPFSVALNKFKSTNYYEAITRVDFTDQPVHNMINATPTLQEAVDAGCVNMADAYFYDIWRAANLTSQLTIDWEKEMSTFNVEAKLEEDGQYHAYADLFKTPELTKLLNGISFVPSGDWQYVGQTAENLCHFVSASGETDESGSIGKFYWPEGKVGFLLPKDISSAKLATFQFYCEGGNGKAAFRNSQTYFASSMDKDLEIFITIGTTPDTDSEIEVKRYQHDENWKANYNVNLIKYDSETGKPLADSHWDILEAFDDGQLDDTDLDLDGPGSYQSNAGTIIPTSWEDGDEISTNYDGDLGLNISQSNLYNWKNDSGSQFKKWDDPLNDPCDRDDNITDADGYLNEINSDGSNSGQRAHTDTKRYLYTKGYCGGHPAPVVEYAEVPDEEYDEEGNCTNEDEIAAIEEENQRLHDEAWAAWYAEVQTCEQLVKDGGFFHAIDAGIAQEAMEEDRDQFYKDFISLTYDYSAKEIKAAPGYILHGTHTDDIPIEWRTVTSSEYKDTDEAENLNHSGGGNDSSDENEQTRSILTATTKNSTDVITTFSSTSKGKAHNESLATPSSAEDSGFTFEDEEIIDEENERLATPSNAVSRKGEQIYTGLVTEINLLDEDDDSSSNRNIVFDPSVANVITPPKENIVDWTFIAYDHRTEGEIHINKRDFNLEQQELFDTYAIANGDGTLEGAVYGLFAANDIEHADNHTGTVYKKDNLVSIATTDRNGNASFMAITEAPGYTYNYMTGEIQKTDDNWADNAPKNLYTNQADADAKEQDNERFLGHSASNNNLSIIDSSYVDDTSYKKHSSNQGVDGTGTTGTYYPIQNNEDNNGNCWIGRPLFVQSSGTQYYIKELTRSEGYELSIYGKDSSIMTNKDAYIAGGGIFTEGKVDVSSIDMDKLNGGNTFTVNSANTTHGYDIYAKNIPEDAHFYMTSTEYVWDDAVTHLEERERQLPVYAQAGSYVLINGTTVEAEVGDTVTLPNGTNAVVSKTFSPDLSKTTVKPGNISKITGTVLAPGTDTGDIIKDVNQLLSKSGYRDTDKGSPWMLIPIDDETQEKVCETINAEFFENEKYNVFNALRLSDIIESNGNKYAVISYAYKNASTIPLALYNEDTQTLFVKKDVRYQENGSQIDGFVYKEYSLDACTDYTTNAVGFVTSAVIPNEIPTQGTIDYLKENISDKITYTIPVSKSYWVYEDGERLRKSNGDYEVRIEKYFEEVSPTQVVKTTNKELTEVLYNGNYEYKVHIDPSIIPTEGNLDFRISFDDDKVLVNGETVSAQNYIYTNGVISISLPLVGADSYIAEVFLTYPGDKEIISDDGTIVTPKVVLERPIRQRIKVMKSILTNPDGTYEHDTYGKVMDTEAVDKMDNFRFKVYLKSNLERLYRDEAGEISWVDRNGNTLVPEYRDTNGDGNYDTFVWRAEDGTQIDYPEYDKNVAEDGTFTGKLSSTNVQKLYTNVNHKSTAMATGDIENNVDFRSVIANDELYSYDGTNTNVGMTDRINAEQNVGYTRLLESVDKIVEDGAGKTRKIRSYNYEKFFAAIDVANKDKWDDDMHTTFTGTSMNNYPGQHWEKTFYEMYQKDDADQAHTIENTDGADKDNTAGGDCDKSFKPFAWIREHIFKQNGEERDYYYGTASNDYIENIINTSDYARANAEASDAVRQFAIDWYLKDEAAKLVVLNGTIENQAKTDGIKYSEEVYDEALFNAIMKSYNYLKPFYQYDLDTMYAVPWDTAENGGADNDYTTLSADILYENGDAGYYYGISSYLPYGTYVTREVQPADDQLGDFANKHYKIDTPKEIELPSIYNADGQMNEIYNYDHADTPDTLASKYHIRFNEEWADNHTDDLRNYIIRAHNYDGDYEVYKYGLDIDHMINASIEYTGGTYTSDGFNITQDEFDPLKNYYNSPLVDVEKDGGNVHSHYHADDKNIGKATANGTTYAENAIERRYHYGSISEDQGTANNVLYPNGSDRDDNNPSGFYFKDNVVTMVGNQTAYQDKYAQMLVPWTVTEPVTVDEYNAADFNGYADIKFRNTFYVTKLRIEKLDSETGENILHDDAIFAIYGAERYTSTAEIRNAVDTGIYGIYPDNYPSIGDVKVYTKDTTIFGSKEFLEGMKAKNIQTTRRAGAGELYSGVVSAGTPICKEEDQIILTDFGTIKDGLIYRNGVGERTGDFKSFSTLNEVLMADEEGNGKTYADQDTGYFITPAPVGAGTYVLVEMKAPSGYVRTDPVAIEVYSDSVEYYKDGDRFSKVPATVYTENIIK